MILVVTGASGAGKTTLVRALEARALPGVCCYYLDSVGVPSPEEMTTRFGSPAGWQLAMTQMWVERLATNPDDVRVAVLDGQVRPSAVLAAFRRAGVTDGRIVLIDCSHPVRDARLRGQRAQPELISLDMAAWAAYLRGQADALELPVIDTTAMAPDAATDALVRLVTTYG